MIKRAPVAQMNRASDSGSEGRRFEPCRAHVHERGDAAEIIKMKLVFNTQPL